jgi:hypothetical protein
LRSKRTPSTKRYLSRRSQWGKIPKIWPVRTAKTYGTKKIEKLMFTLTLFIEFFQETSTSTYVRSYINAFAGQVLAEQINRALFSSSCYWVRDFEIFISKLAEALRTNPLNPPSGNSSTVEPKVLLFSISFVFSYLIKSFLSRFCKGMLCLMPTH